MLNFMGLFQKMLAFFRPKAEPAALSSAEYSDEEFLNFVMEQARKRSQAEQVMHAATLPATTPSGPLSKAA
jgi:hypothetical protein